LPNSCNICLAKFFFRNGKIPSLLQIPLLGLFLNFNSRMNGGRRISARWSWESNSLGARGYA